MKLSFQEPASIFCYNLVALHHDILWYIILIISLVYWVLIRILTEFSWIAFKKRKFWMLGLPTTDTYIHSRLFLWHGLFFTAWIWYTSKTLKKYFFIIYEYWALKAIKKIGKKNFFYKYFLGKENNLYVIPEDFTIYFHEEDYPKTSYMLRERYLSSFLHQKPSRALYFYDGKDTYLNVEKFKHSTILEYIYGIFPTIIIVLILLPSLCLLYSIDEDVNPVFTIKVIGHQWFWSYEYNNYYYFNNIYKSSEIAFDSNLILEEDLMKGGKRLLETDFVVVIPTSRAIRFVITSSDVLHSWAVPSLGIKTDAVPGRLNQVITMVCKPGIYYGQCSELCGVNHGFMPIIVNSILEQQFLNYIKQN